MNNDFGLKELYTVSLKLTYPIEVSGRKMEAGEIIAQFDEIRIADFSENKKFASANGGFDNRSLVWWEETKDIHFSLTQGVFSKIQLGLMTNAKLLNIDSDQPITIACREEVETDERGIAILRHPIASEVFVYDRKTGDKISDWMSNDNQLILQQAYQEIVVDYQYNHIDGATLVSFGNALTNGFLSLEGRLRVKDDITGQVKTGIIKIPKLKLLSNLSMRLGNDAIPQVGRLDAVAVPTGPKGSKRIMEIYFLNDDIDSDM